MIEVDVKEENELATIFLDVAFKLHRSYGPGLFESVYEELICYELSKEGVPYKRQYAVPLVHETIKLDTGFRADLILDNKLLIEIKSIEKLADIHFRQVQTYLKLSGLKLGLLINFNNAYLKDGIKRIINTP